jgi:hypothetical protein
MQALLTHAESLDAILATGRLTISGDTDAARRLLTSSGAATTDRPR